MEQSIRENDYVLIVCTPNYKHKSENRTGGVGYEGDVIQAEVFETGKHRKFIPLLRGGNWTDSAPSHLGGKFYVDLREHPSNLKNYQELLRTLHSAFQTPPKIGAKPDFDNLEGRFGHAKEMTEIPGPKTHRNQDQVVDRLRKFLVRHENKDDPLTGYWELFRWPVPERTKSMMGMSVRGNLALFATTNDSRQYSGIMTMIAYRPGSWESGSETVPNGESPCQAWYEVELFGSKGRFHGTSRMVGKEYFDPEIQRQRLASKQPHYVHTGLFSSCTVTEAQGGPVFKGHYENTPSSGRIDFSFCSHRRWIDASNEVLRSIPFGLSSRRSLSELMKPRPA